MKKDQWNPEQYNKFKDQRAQPFRDLIAPVRPTAELRDIVDLGCGTGELTAELSAQHPQATVLGLDLSAAMLSASEKLSHPKLRFRQTDLNEYQPTEKFDLVVSNATLQWLPDHETLFPRVLSWVAPHGQVAIQMPYNFDHPSHRIAHEVAEEFPSLKSTPKRNQLSFECYGEILFREGFAEQKCRMEIYQHPMSSGADVIEWTKGTLLTAYQSQLTEEEFREFVARYRRRLLAQIGVGPYLYGFKRILLWGKRHD